MTIHSTLGIILAASALLRAGLARAAPAAHYVVDHVAIDPSWNANQAPLQPDDPREPVAGELGQIPRG